MTADIREYISLAFNDELDYDSTKSVFKLVMDGEVNDIQISSFLSIIQKTGIKSYHITSAIEVMKTKMIEVNCPNGSIDTCGTGGDGKNSLNISTAVAFLLASRGIPVAKHGNRALTSKCGSADVLKALNINIDMQISKLEECINKVGICFMFAPNHHPAMKHVGPVRQELGIQTIFNMLGPLLNPANVNKQIVGVYSKNVFDLYKEIFEKNSHKQVCLISGYDGNDEISLDGENIIFTKNNGVKIFNPRLIDLPTSKLEELTGKDAEYNASRIIEMFNKNDTFSETVCINAAFALLLHDSEDINDNNILNAYKESKSIINSGLPLKIIEDLSKFTNS